jgi:hypothetical protein
MSIALGEWIDLLQREYLDDFIRAGGGAVKIAVTPDAQSAAVNGALADASASGGYQFVSVSAARVRVHMIHLLFHEIARQIDWEATVDRWLRRQLHDSGIAVEDGQSLSDMDAIAAANGRTRPQLLGEVNRLITNGILKDYELAKEFRTAMRMLCLGLVNPQNVAPTDADVITLWLRGEPTNLTALKRLEINQKIGRHNARLLLNSLAVWLHKTGVPGMVLALDIHAVVAPAPPDAIVRYTRPSLLDTFEVLRQCIDETDETRYLLTVALAGPGLIDDPKRNLDNYDALKMRVWDEVRDRDRANPLSAMVRLEAAGGGAQ